MKPKRNAGAVFSEKKAILRAISDNRKLLKGEKGKTRDLLAKRVGVSGQTLEKAMAVVESGDQKLIKMMDEAARDAALYDAQILAIALLWAEARLGELLKTNPPGFQRGKSGQIKQNPLPPGITHKQSFYAQRLAEILKNRLVGEEGGGALP